MCTQSYLLSLLFLSLIGCSAQVSRDVRSESPGASDAGTDAGAPMATKATVEIGSTWALVASDFSDGATTMEIQNNYDSTPVCTSGYSKVSLEDLSGDPLVICIPSNLTCPPMPNQAVTHQPSDIETLYCEVT